MMKNFLQSKMNTNTVSRFFLVFVVVCSLSTSSLFSQATTTTLTKAEEIKTFLEATGRIRCICLPSLPIQACSYNMCMVSSYLKSFIENRIRAGMTADEIVQKFETGFGEGDEILNDPVIMHFQDVGNLGMANAIFHGFGENIQAKPDASAINWTLGIGSLLALFGIFFYLKKMRNDRQSNLANTESPSNDSSFYQEKYKNEI